MAFVRAECQSYGKSGVTVVNFCHSEGQLPKDKVRANGRPACPVAVITRPLWPVI